MQHGLAKEQGYASGIAPGLALFEACKALGVEEVSVYRFTQDNTRRPTAQANQFRAACVAFAGEISRRDAALLVLGDETSKQFPVELAAFRTRQGEGIKVNFLVNYGWEWDLDGLKEGRLRSADVSRLDLVVRWGGGRRLSGFLPVQSVYAEIFVLDALVARLRASAPGRCAGLVWPTGPDARRLKTAHRRSTAMPLSTTTPHPDASG